MIRLAMSKPSIMLEVQAEGAEETVTFKAVFKAYPRDKARELLSKRDQIIMDMRTSGSDDTSNLESFTIPDVLRIYDFPLIDSETGKPVGFLDTDNPESFKDVLAQVGLGKSPTTSECLDAMLKRVIFNSYPLQQGLVLAHMASLQNLKLVRDTRLGN